ncbi:MAG: SAM-dependent methyltransferase [Chryseolinea sp.]
MKYGTIYLIPNIIAEHTEKYVITEGVRRVLPNIVHFLAEDIRTARRYLKTLSIYQAIEPLKFETLNKDTLKTDIKRLLQPALDGHDLGILSDSGCPGIADPGAIAVAYAHEVGIKVIPLVGPSSILLALMASGLNGQRFTFHGYLPIDTQEAAKTIRDLERESKQRNLTQIFIETPYRSNSLFNTLIKNLGGRTLLSIAVDITSESEDIRTLSVSKWKNVSGELPKSPTVFSFLAI